MLNSPSLYLPFYREGEGKCLSLCGEQHEKKGFPCGSVVKNMPANARDTGDMGLSPGSGISLGEGNGNPLKDSCCENPMDRGASKL